MKPAAAVIVAFGPQPAATRSARLARRLVGRDAPVLVVPAHAGTGVSGREHGAKGLQAALASCPDGPVLLMHDDVTVAPHAASALLRAWSEHAGLVVPWSSDPDVDNDVARRGSQRGTSTVHRVRPACVLGDRQELGQLAELHAHAARTTVDAAHVAFTLAHAAVVQHADNCATRLAPPVGPDGRPLLVATLIVKDEEAVLGDCLASLEGLVDEIVVCDTGSTDGTVAIAESFGARVIHRPWRNDFAWARNQALEAAADAWYAFCIDADERVVCGDKRRVRALLATYIGDYDGFNVMIDSSEDDAGAFSMSHHNTRVLRPGPIRFVGALHENPARVDGGAMTTALLSTIRLEHLGYRPTVMAAKSKRDRNLDLAARAYAADASLSNLVNYARAAESGGEVELASELYERALGFDELSPAMRARILASLAVYASDAGDDERCKDLAARGLELVPAEPIAAAMFARAAERLGHAAEIVVMVHHHRTARSPHPIAEHELCRVTVANHLVRAHAALGDTAAAYDEAERIAAAHPGQLDAWDALGAIDDDAQLARYARLAAEDAGTAFLQPAVDGWPIERTAQLCAAYCAAGGRAAEAVSTGLVAASLAGRHDLLAQLLSHVDRLDLETVTRIAARAEQRGDAESAQALRASLQPA
jgi:tetratricopeptide (TPR) repeat protein